MSVQIGLVVHAGRRRSIDAATQAAGLLRDLGAKVRVARPNDDDAEAVDERGVPVELAEHVDADAGFADGLDLAISFGGDGTFLRAAHLCRDAGVPVLGVNIGRLGFMAEVELDDLESALETVVAASFSIEDRATLEVTVQAENGTVVGRGWALNEVSIEKTARQRLLLMDLYLDDTLFAKVPADALIVATATGSTAYALSAGGPIVSPQIEATLVVPVAPHTLFDRTVVAGIDEPVRVELVADQPPALVSCDGRQPLQVGPGCSITVTGRGRPVRLARLRRSDFYAVVRRKFGLR